MLEDKVIAITGAGRGIGRAEAIACAQAGAGVVVNDVGGSLDGEGRDSSPAQDVVDELTGRGFDAVAHFGDIADEDGARALIATALERWGRLDGVVNNAGIVRDRMLFKMSVEEWDSVVRVHLRGTFLVSREACAHWRAEAKAGSDAGGSIVNTSSTSGLLGVVGQSNYGAAKAGIAALTQIAALEMRRYGVRCNAIAPGARTRLSESAFPELPSFDDRPSDPLAPEGVAALVTYLLSEDSAGTSGHVFGVQGGLLQLYAGWEPVATVSQEQVWRPEEIGARFDELFEQRPQVYEPPEEMFRALVASEGPPEQGGPPTSEKQ